MNKETNLIQKIYRGYIIRKKLKILKDKMNLDILNNLLDRYISNYKYLIEINEKLSIKKCRNENFPSHISENIVKFALFKKYGIMPNWDTKSGDLELVNKKLEIKGFMSDGPSSFGPTENWDWIYFIDAKDFINKRFKIYEIKLSNKSDIWRNIVLSEKKVLSNELKIQNELPNNLEKLTVKELNELCKQRGLSKSKTKDETIKKLKNFTTESKLILPTFGSTVDKNSRGQLRGSFYGIFKPQLDKHCKLIFDDNLVKLSQNINEDISKLINKIKTIEL